MPSQFLIEKLKASGLTPEDINATDTFDFSGICSGFKIPYWNPDGTEHPHMFRIRLANPPPGTGKYTQPSTEELVRAGHPANVATLPYLNPNIFPRSSGLTWDTFGASQGKRLLIVEGELKAMAAGKMLQMAAVGIPGCDGGVRQDERGVKHVHPILRPLFQPRDYVEIVLDGDILTNPNVNRAAGTLKRAMGRFGIKPVFVLLPAPVAGRGIGLDDWLVGIPEADRMRAFTALPRTYGEDFDECLISVADYFGLAVNAKGYAMPNVSNLQILFEKHERFKDRYFYDVMRDNIYRTSPVRPFVDDFVFDEQVWLQRRIGMTVTKNVMLDALRWMAGQPRWQRNLLLESLPEWDGVGRLERMFIDGWGADDNEHVRAVGRNWLVSAMARANEPGCKVDTMLVLIGGQGIKKSKSLEIMAGEFYVPTHVQVKDKDFLMALHRGWMIDMAELSSMNHSDAGAIKGIITTATDHYRPPYAATMIARPRHSIMVGTTNEERFLRDGTGNRRFWPLECGVIDTDWIAQHRGQLLAEAQAAYKAGQTWWIMPASTLAAQAERLEIGPWDAPLRSILSGAHGFRIIVVSGVSYRYITSEELLKGLGIETQHRKSHMYRDLKSAMERIGGWEHKFVAQRIALPDGGTVDRSNGYRTPVSGNPTATVIPITSKY